MTPIESKRKLVKVALQMIGLDGALVGAEKPSFEQGSHPVDTGHGDVSRITAIGDDSPSMNQSVSGEIVVATPAIGQHGGPARHGIADEWHQTCARRIRNTKHPYPSEALGRSQLDGDRNQRLASRTTATLAAMFFTANQGFINFHLTAQAIAIWTNHRRAKAVQHRPRRLLGAEAQQALKRLGRNPILRRGHVPGNSEPNRQRCTSAVEDRPRGHRHTTPAAFTPKPPVTHPPTLGGSAARANETVWPAQPIKIVETGVIIGKPRAQLGIVTRVIVTALESRGRKLLRHPYILCLPHSDGHPLKKDTVISKRRCFL